MAQNSIRLRINFHAELKQITIPVEHLGFHGNLIQAGGKPDSARES